MIKIIHLADIHIRNNKRFDEYNEQFNKTYTKIKELNPNYITVVGDLYDNFITVSNEADTLAGDFLRNLSDIAPVITVPGNHDLRKTALKRKNSLEKLVDILKIDNIQYFNKSGFFTDKFNSDIIWVNYSHLQKKEIPWETIKYKKDNNKLYIGLFHDPVYGCKLPSNITMNKSSLLKLDNFKYNDLNLFGDIHLKQFFNDTTAYCGSLIQQTFGEKETEHGFILWQIDDKNITSEFINISNDYSLINFKISTGFDYDNINFNNKYLTKKSKIKVIWNDYSQNINISNENKIIKYINSLGIDDIRFEKNRIYTDMSDSGILDNNIDISNIENQQQIFKDYLKLNKFDKKFIKRVLDIDNIINSRLNYKSVIDNIEWNIDYLEVDNFKSYDKFKINWTDLSGIIQLNGKNQQGKTTIIDAITYALYGTTLATKKREKHGDNRFINNKRDLDYCQVKIILDINSQKYTMIRRTEKELTKKGTVKDVKTILNVWKGIELTEDNKDNEEGRIKTQKYIDGIIGDIDSFTRLVLTNAQNLNDIISVDRAKFIDSISRDAGFDIFEKKLDEYKKYKKELDEKTKIKKIDILTEEEKIKALNEKLNNFNININDKINNINKIKLDINIIDKHINKLNKQLFNIDDDIKTLNITELSSLIETYKVDISKIKNKLNENINYIEKLPDNFNNDKYDNLFKQVRKSEDDINDIKVKIMSSETTIDKEKNTIQKVDDKIEALIEKEIDKLSNNINDKEKDIKLLLNKINSIIEKEKSNKENKINKINYEIENIKNDISRINTEGKKIKEEKTELENTTECSLCKRPFKEDDKHKIHINNKIEKLNNLLKELKENKIKKKNKIEDLSSDIIKLNNEEFIDNDETLNIKNDIKNIRTEIDNINNTINNINDKKYPEELQNRINKGLDIKEKSKNNIKKLKESIKEYRKDIKDKELNISDIKSELSKLEEDKKKYDVYVKLINENDKLNNNIEKYKLNIEKININIKKYHKQLKEIENNERIEKEINEKQDIKNNLNEKLNILINEKTEILSNIKEVETDIKEIKNDIIKYKDYLDREIIYKQYMKCVHRDGIPTFLLQKSKDILNAEFEDLLTNVDFNIIFDDKLNLKMYMKNQPNILQNLIESSGKERTFSATIIKFALRNINKRSKPKFMIFDEVTGTLDKESVQVYIDMLNETKKNIDKILLIEHNHELLTNHSIVARKNEKGISSIEII